MLAMHKDAQKKVIDEIDEVVASVEEIDNETLSKFTYVELVIKEALRLFPAGGIIGRQSTEEINLGGYVIPKDTVMILSVYGMQRSPKFWGDDAHLFKPERFESGNINPHAFAPFSGKNYSL
jgi:cytochrome P450